MRVAVVGTCAAGKSSLVEELRSRGLDAYAVAQEHSAIPRLWAHLAPDRLVYLQTSLDTVRRRRGDTQWPEWIYEVQVERLADAREHADVTIGTDSMSVAEIADRVIVALTIPDRRHASGEELR
jgi:site-specific recombinase XerD